MKNIKIVFTMQPKLISFVLTLLLITITTTSCNTQSNTKDSSISSTILESQHPKLVIGITIDQMRADYINRFGTEFSDGGFARIIDGGFVCYDHHFGYAPTYTGPGHASIYTGTTPSVNGIVANNWYIKEESVTVYCAEDSTVRGVGNNGVDSDGSIFGYAGKMSPSRLLSTTIGDELKLASGLHAKVIGISLKDRGAILPAGHSADNAFWFYGKEYGHFISSTYYGKTLPVWAEKFNNKGEAERLVNLGWDLLRDEAVYSSCTPDNNPYEGSFVGEIKPTFPYDLNALKEANGGFDILKGTPGGNTILVDFALAAIEGENLGEDDICDMLAVSFSATDYVGHRCGPHAMETMDMYIRLDLELERFFDGLDEKVGKGMWTVFLTSDHGGATVPSYGQSIGLPVDYWSHGDMQNRIEEDLDKRFGERLWIENVSNNSIFISDEAYEWVYSDATGDRINASELQRYVCKLALEEDGIIQSIAVSDLASRAAVDPIAERIYAGHRPGVSGDVLLVMKPGWLTYGRTGTTHGSPFTYDTHVPCLFYGAGIKKGATHTRTYIRDIAPTISSILGIPYPNGTTGQPISVLLD
ncbi:MAG TPA: alkaline phosphatase family protein [Flavobacteriales bacterium]|nr:alkaline phosphatase family protein [Flavobacteriales bacterium]HIB76144.1 alkaline phosphatase family protein [Flavobacteriales bacterium]HIN41313.1 alkaline phosphatase family protein [Flavobacteriales bacterium]HIO15349.1 alkaline phosphatase family protein [Flavobacteriales bacterium]